MTHLCGEQHDWHATKLRVRIVAQGTTDLQPILARHAPIEQDERGPFKACQVQGCLTVVRGQQSIALRGECGHEQVDNVRLIIHHQDGRRADPHRTHVINGA